MQKKLEELSSVANETPLPAERAFVVQLRTQIDPEAELFTGRVEHIASGTAQRFGSADGLIAFMRGILAPGKPPSGEDESNFMPKVG